MSKRRPGWYFLAGLVLVCRPLLAQTVRGTLREDPDSAAVAGALVLLLDSAGTERTRTVTYESGGFALRAPEPGRYHLKVLRIGSTEWISPAFALSPSQVLNYRVRLPRSPVLLSEIVTTAHSACRLHPDSTAVTALVWEEVRKAMALTLETVRHGPYVFATRTWRRRYDPGFHLLSEERLPGADLRDWPIVSRSPDSLAQLGYVLDAGDENGPVYYGIDAALLFSPSFLDRHCFHAEPGPGSSRLVGLSFEPVEHSGRPDVRGTLWLSTENAELQYLEFSYTGLARWIPRDQAGGRLDFLRLANGAWLVQRWWLRAPIRVDHPGREPTVGGWLMAGGDVIRVLDRSGHVLQALEAKTGS